MAKKQVAFSGLFEKLHPEGIFILGAYKAPLYDRIGRLHYVF